MLAICPTNVLQILAHEEGHFGREITRNSGDPSRSASASSDLAATDLQ